MADVQHEENVICAQFGKDLFNISKVIGRKKVAQFFWLPVYNGLQEGQGANVTQ